MYDTSSRRSPTSPMPILSSSSSIISFSSLSTLDFYTRLTPKAQPTTTLSSIVVSSSDTSIGGKPQNASLRLKGMMQLPSDLDNEKLSDSDDEVPSETIRGRRPRYASLTVERFMSSLTRTFSVSSSRSSSPTPSRTHLRPPRIIITPPPSSPVSPRKPRPLRSPSYATNSTTIMNPILAKLERDSKFCAIKIVCSTCGKVGHGYPRCSRCGDMWCSRTCRIGSEGKKHVCRRTN
jgi:hypothetical protein